MKKYKKKHNGAIPTNSEGLPHRPRTSDTCNFYDSPIDGQGGDLANADVSMNTGGGGGDYIAIHESELQTSPLRLNLPNNRRILRGSPRQQSRRPTNSNK